MFRAVYWLLFAALAPTLAFAQSAVKFPTAQLPGLTDNAVLSASLHKPEGSRPFPAVIVLHDCGGMEGHVVKWAKMLVSWGYVSIVPDSFGSRGKSNLCANVEAVGTAQRVQDTIGAAEYLATLPFVQKDKIGVVGFSHGGWTIMKGVQENAYWSSYGIKVAVGIYPYCGPQDNKVALPLLILIGEKDDWTPVSRCQAAAYNCELVPPVGLEPTLP
jgi:dienelactone hydrolase